MKRILILLTIFILYGCQSNKIEILNPPNNLRYVMSTNTISWDHIDGAFAYILSVNDVLYDVEGNTFVVNLPSGKYKIKVRAQYESGLSRFTVPIDIEIVKNEIFDYTISDSLSFSPIEGATSYSLKIYNVFLNEIIYDDYITSPYDLTTLMGSNFRFELKAYFLSNVIANTTFIVDFTPNTYTKDSTEFIININEPIISLYLDNARIDTENYIQTTTEIIFLSDYLEALEDGIYVLKLQGTVVLYKYLMITSYEKPVLVSSNNLTYDGEELTFTFDLKGGSFEGIAANPKLTESDYTFTGNTLIINKSYFDKVLLENPSRKSIIFSYVISNGPNTVIGYITVRL